MANPLQIYADNFGNTHEAAVDAVYQQGVQDGLEKAAAAFLAQGSQNTGQYDTPVSSEALVNVNLP